MSRYARVVTRLAFPKPASRWEHAPGWLRRWAFRVYMRRV